MVQRIRWTPSPRGLRRPFDLHLPGAPLLRREAPPFPSGKAVSSIARRHTLVPPCSVPRPWRQDASNPFLQPTFTSRAPAGNTCFGDRPSSAVGNPPTFDFETAPRVGSRPGVRAAPDHLAVIRPPTAARLTAREPASGLPTTSFSQGTDALRRGAPTRSTSTGGEAPGRSRPEVPLSTRPSDTSRRRLDKDPRLSGRAPVPAAWPCLHRSTSMLPVSTEPRCLPSWETSRRSPFEPRRGALPWLAGPDRCRACSSRWVTATRPLFVRSSRASSRPRALSRLLQRMFPRARPRTSSNIPNDRKPSLGRLPPCVESRLSPRQPRKLLGDRGRATPCLGAPRRDCSRQRLCPDPDCFGHLLSRGPFFSLSGATWEQSGTANAAHTCAVRATRGSCDVRPPRRGETLTNPRGLPSPSRPRHGRVHSDHPEPRAAPHDSASFTAIVPGEGRSLGP